MNYSTISYLLRLCGPALGLVPMVLMGVRMFRGERVEPRALMGGGVLLTGLALWATPSVSPSPPRSDEWLHEAGMLMYFVGLVVLLLAERRRHARQSAPESPESG